MTAIVQVFSSGLLSKGLMALGLVLLMRYLPTGQWADYTFAYALVGIASPMLSTLFNMIFIVGETKRTRRDTASFFAAQVWICTGLIAASCLVWRWEGDLLLAAALLNFTLCLSEFTKTCYQQQLQFARLSLVEFTRSAMFLLGIGGLLALRGERVTASEVLYVQAATMLPLVLPLAWRCLDRSSLWSIRDWGSVLVDLTTQRYRYVTGYYVLLTILGQAAVLLMKGMASEAELANFGAAIRIYGLLMLALHAVLVVQLPAIKQAAGVSGVRAILARHGRTIVPAAAVLAAGAFASPWLLPWIDGGKYPHAPYLLQILCLSVACSYALSPYAHVVMRAGDFRFMFRVMAVVAPLSILGCGCLLVYGGTYAMTWGFVATYLLANLATYYRAQQWLNREAAGEAISEPMRLAA